ncbi:uncharacterized protein LOC119732990 [Patiria miniata]|uniref:Receptor protein-tyrosine kinase n=1 Tax=Patiria miniata TaxID=46514 RepID=A0A914AGI4_PATMI|nr:uncharacterized protein LOC119732990 [Patiria miniata]
MAANKCWLVSDWYTSAEIEDLNDKVYLGDILEFRRRSWVGRHPRWGIYVGRYQDMKHVVIYFSILEGEARLMSSFASQKPEIGADTIGNVLGGYGKVRINNSRDKYQNPSDPLSIVETAKKMHQDKTQDEYKLFGNNYEHFVNNCRYRDSPIKQVPSTPGTGSFLDYAEPVTEEHKTSRHLRMVLNEVNKNLPKREQVDRRLQLPYIAMGYFNERGGSLSLDEYGVHLTIPRGAIAPGSPQQVYIYVDPTAPPTDAVEPTEVALSPSVKCGPEGLTFKESVVLSFPHHSVLTGQRYINLVVRMHHDDSQEKQWEDDNPALVTEKEVFVLVDHFTNFTLVVTPIPGSSKRLKVGAFGGLLDKRRCQYAFRVHVWNDEESVEQSVLREEERMKSEMLDVFRKLQFFWDSGDLVVRVTDLDSGWAIREATEQTIYKEKIRVQEENSVTFNLKRKMGDSEDEGLYCAVRTDQHSPNEDLRRQTQVLLNFCPEKKPLSTWEWIVDKILKLTRVRQQTPGSRATQCTENNSPCVCYRTGDLCGYCKEQIGKEWSKEALGEVRPQDYGGFSQQTVHALCVLLDAGNNWTKLLEKMTIVEGTVVRHVVQQDTEATSSTIHLSPYETAQITSPSYPGNYANGLDVTWVIQTIACWQIQIITSSFRTESCCDRLKGGDGMDSTDLTTVLFESRGSIGPDALSHGPAMWLRFTTDGSVTYGGFRLLATSVSSFASLDFNCTFENGRCGWTQSTDDDSSWARDSGGTPSSNTGPSIDKTRGDTSGYYYYFEASVGSEGNTAVLLSPVVSINAVHSSCMPTLCFGFWYNMYGDGMGALNVYRIPVNQGINDGEIIFTRSGQQTGPTTWLFEEICLQNTTLGFRIALQAVRGNSFTSDIAIDDLSLTVPSMEPSLSLNDTSGSVKGGRTSVMEGATHFFLCTVHQTRPAATIQWFLNDDLQRTVDPSSGGSVCLVDTTSSWTFVPSRANHGQRVKCVASTVESQLLLVFAMVTVDVAGPPDTPVITGNPSVTANEAVQLTCQASNGYPDDWELVWSNGGLPLTGTHTTAVSTSGSRYRFSSTLIFTPTIEDNGNMITCSARRGSQALTGSLGPVDVLCPPKESSLTLYDSGGNVTSGRASVMEGAHHSLLCTVRQTRPAATLQWFMNDALQRTVDPPSGESGGLVDTTSSWTFVPNRTNHGQKVKCVAGTAESQLPLPFAMVTVDVTGPPDTPAVTGNRSMTANETVQLICRANHGYPDDWELVWTNGGLPLAGTQTTAMLTLGNRHRFSSALNFTPTREENGNMITCSARRGSWTSELTGSLGPIDVQYWPEFSEPSVTPSNHVEEGDDVILSCKADANPKPVDFITWEKVGSPGSLPSVYSDGSSTLTLSSISREQAGTYRCRGDNGVPPVVYSSLVEVIFRSPVAPSVVGVLTSWPFLTAVSVLGILLLISIVIQAACCFYRKRKRSSQNKEQQRVSQSGAGTGGPVRVFADTECYETVGISTEQQSISGSGAGIGRPVRVIADTECYEDMGIPMQTIRAVESDSSRYADTPDRRAAISRDQLTFLQELTQGTFGKVLLARAVGIEQRGLITHVAVKTVKDKSDPKEKENLIRELNSMKPLTSHENIVKLLGYCINADPIYVIMEHVANGNLKEILTDSRSERVYDNLRGAVCASLSPKTLLSLARGVAKGMAYLASQGCLHQDLAARNVLVSEDMVSKISDFGFASDVAEMRTHQRKNTGFSPLRWMALESILDDVYTTESDVWSFGVLLWEIVTLGGHPYPTLSAKKVVSKVKSGYRMPRPDHCRLHLYQVVRPCWSKNPAARPTFATIAEKLGGLVEKADEYLSLESCQENIYKMSVTGGSDFEKF